MTLTDCIQLCTSNNATQIALGLGTRHICVASKILLITTEHNIAYETYEIISLLILNCELNCLRKLMLLFFHYYQDLIYLIILHLFGYL